MTEKTEGELMFMARTIAKTASNLARHGDSISVDYIHSYLKTTYDAGFLAGFQQCGVQPWEYAVCLAVASESRDEGESFSKRISEGYEPIFFGGGEQGVGMVIMRRRKRTSDGQAVDLKG
jgi:hypothetical protein